MMIHKHNHLLRCRNHVIQNVCHFESITNTQALVPKGQENGLPEAVILASNFRLYSLKLHNFSHTSLVTLSCLSGDHKHNLCQTNKQQTLGLTP